MSLPTLTLLGAPASPYTRKMRALLRYRRFPHRFVLRRSKHDPDDWKIPVDLMPVLVLPTEGGAETATVDSTFQIRKLETLSDERSVIHPDPALAFLDALLEDYADEWLTKAMFHYRWAFSPDVDNAGAILPLAGDVALPQDVYARMSRAFSDRQVGRLGVVGSNEQTAALIEESYADLLRALSARLGQAPFVMGGRPGTSDFGLFGQLTQLVQFDPTPMAVARTLAPRVCAWCDVVEDLSGIEVGKDDWLSREDAPSALGELLAEVGRTYAPFLLGNAAALESGAERVECEIAGRTWVQKPFPYQAKCLAWLREQYAALDADARDSVDTVLAGTGCDALFRD